ncbi:alpha/beta fold hydrolase [Pannonibacter indicus]|uniref:alpha/beta fold hydrolase n=1 Tax=Pannonibacter indicus TaxID=466044 RepID=UPI001FCA7A86|nr:alpha/beta hydrolase [Pannonibacter indicus]
MTLRGKGGVPIVFAHGLGCDQTMWKDVAPAFEASSQVILFDLIGFGNSDHSCFSYERYQSLADYADDCIELIEHVCSEPVIFVGHSVSAMIGVLAAGKRPDLFRQLVLIGPSPCYVNDGAYQGGFNAADIEGLIEAMRSNYLGWTKGIAPLIMGNPERPELTEVLEESFCRTDPDVAQHFAALTFWSDNRSDLASVTTPALVIQCDPPPLNGSTLKYGFDPEGGPQWQTSDTSPTRSSRSFGRLRFCAAKAWRWRMPFARSAFPS